MLGRYELITITSPGCTCTIEIAVKPDGKIHTFLFHMETQLASFMIVSRSINMLNFNDILFAIMFSTRCVPSLDFRISIWNTVIEQLCLPP